MFSNIGHVQNGYFTVNFEAPNRNVSMLKNWISFISTMLHDILNRKTLMIITSNDLYNTTQCFIKYIFMITFVYIDEIGYEKTQYQYSIANH